MKKRAGAVRFWAVTFILVFVVAYFCTETVTCRVDVETAEIEAYYREKEVQLVEETRAFLDEEGFRNSGVMLTKVVNADGSREYTLTVHHGRMDALTENDRAILLGKMDQLAFAGEGVSFFHEFLLNE